MIKVPNLWRKIQPKSKQNHSHTHSKPGNIHISSPQVLVFTSPSGKQIIKLQANTEQNWAFNNYTILKSVRKMLNNIQNVIHMSCLPLNSDFSHIEDTVANRKIHPYRYASQYLFLHLHPPWLVSYFKWNWYMARLTPNIMLVF